MSSIKQSALELIGNTPMIHLSRYSEQTGIHTATLLGKLEFMNPSGSVKDRIALSMIQKAEAEGLLTKDSTLIEPTSGNAGIGLAAVAACKGYRVVLTMPDTMSIERRNYLRAYGAEIILTDGALGMAGAIKKARELHRCIPNSLFLDQFENSANPDAHYTTTGPEIWHQTDGRIDYFVAGVGTGGTLTGVGRYLKEQNPNVRIIGVEPFQSPVLSKGIAGPHGIMGIGAGFVPKTLDTSIYDQVLTVHDHDAYTEARLIARTEGILVGISSGAALRAAKSLAIRAMNRGKTIVVLLPDSGNRYLSTKLYSTCQA